MGLLFVPELEAVLDGPQEAIRVGERRRVADVDVARVHELRERFERGGRPDARVVAAYLRRRSTMVEAARLETAGDLLEVVGRVAGDESGTNVASLA